MTIFYDLYDSPTGELMMMSDGQRLTDLHMSAGKYVPAIDERWVRDGQQSVFTQTKRELDAYFLGTLRAFTVPLAPRGTDFQRSAWHALTQISFGTTCTYGQQAARMGNPKAVRAVGAANGKNPIGIIIPCHRVIGANGALTGYAGGLHNKEFLLKLEGIF
jgi:methylated-DNA-[protein]-cysteine S-methyltransferase